MCQKNFFKSKPFIMAYKRRESAAIIDKTTTRVAAMAQIDTNQSKTIDYGGGVRGAITAATVQTKLTDYAAKLQQYNQLLQQADTTANALADMEADIASDYAAVLKSAIGKFGENSSEVEMLGGTRKDERKKRTSKKAA